MKPSIPLLLSFNGGYVDTAGFLALHGLFTAHVTGNFVTLGASMVYGSSGAIAKLIALPVFCAVIVLSRVATLRLPMGEAAVFRTMLLVKVALLTFAAAFSILWGPFADADEWHAMLTGMTLVTAMAIQNAAHRIHLGKAPPITLMTGTSTQIMIDIADLIARKLPAEERPTRRSHMKAMGASVAYFAAGCGLAAVAFISSHMWVFALPPLIALASSLLARQEGQHATA